jgi:SAM-dependent methyltransferase
MFMSIRKRRHLVSSEAQLVPSAEVMRREGVETLEAWFAGGREWAMLLSVFGGLGRKSWVLEMGAGAGQIAFALRNVLSTNAIYDGLEASPKKWSWLDEQFAPVVPNFRFKLADVRTPENRQGAATPETFVYPYPDSTFHVIFSAQAFARFAPDATAQGLREAARMLKPGGRMLIGVHLLDNFRRGQPRPRGFNTPAFEFTLPFRNYDPSQFALCVQTGFLQGAAYRLEMLQGLAEEAGLVLQQPPLPGRWSGSHSGIAAKDVLVLEKPATDEKGERIIVARDAILL